MALDGVSNRTSYIGFSLINMRQQIEQLQQQLSSGRKANTYAGMGVDRGFGVSLRRQLTSIESFADTITNVDVRIKVADMAIGRLVDIGSEARSAAATAPSQIDQTGQTTSQKSAMASLAEMLQLLNSRSGDRYLFSGRATDAPAVETLGAILDGNGGQAGLKQIIAERKQADLGVGGLGRVAVATPTATSLSLTEDAAGSPFGLKLGAVTSLLTGATVSGPSGSPASLSVDLGATNPNDGDKIRFVFNLPDGTTETIELMATASASAASGTFQIGADTTATAANLNAALTSAIGKLANTSLVAASAVAASADFFGSPPQRVAGPPFDTATALVAGTPADTVSWYTGETGTDPARGTAVARIDQSMTVQYGVRADEEAFRWQLENIAAFAVMTASPSDPNASGQVTALNQRIAQNLSAQDGKQTLQDIQADLAGAQTAMSAAKDRQTQTKSMLQTMLDEIEGVSNDEIAMKILALQTNLQASYQTTSILYQMALTNYL